MRRSLVAPALGALAPLVVASATPAHPAPQPAPPLERPRFAGGDFPPAPASGLHRNGDGEPAMGVAADGTFWASGLQSNDPRHTGDLGGDDVWRSTDGGRSYQWRASPFNLVPGGGGPGGDDTDTIVAPERNSSGHSNVYVASLWGTGADPLLLGNISLAVSQDDGATWIVHPLAAEVPLDDRPWLAADGPCTVYLTYHGALVETIVEKYDLCDVADLAGGLTLTPVTSSRILDLAPKAAAGAPATYATIGFGKTQVDTSPKSPYRHRVYVPAMDCGDLGLSAELDRAQRQDPNCPGAAEVVMLVGTDGGTTWTLHRVTRTPNHFVALWPGTAAVDAAGTVYFTWHDNTNAYLDVSHDGGTTWSPPRRVNHDPSAGAVYPTAAAGRAGVVDVAWYGTTVAGDANDPKVMGAPGAPGSALWRVYWTQSTDGGLTFDQTVASDVVHKGALCTRGTGCTIPNSRALLDDFGMQISPTTGLASIAYSSDQPEGASANRHDAYATELALPRPHCLELATLTGDYAGNRGGFAGSAESAAGHGGAGAGGRVGRAGAGPGPRNGPDELLNSGDATADA